MTNEDIHLMHILGLSEERELFDSKTLIQYIEYKWDVYGKRHYLIGCAAHILYVLIYIVFINVTYLYDHELVPHNEVTCVLLLFLLYPLIYDTI